MRGAHVLNRRVVVPRPIPVVRVACHIGQAAPDRVHGLRRKVRRFPAQRSEGAGLIDLAGLRGLAVIAAPQDRPLAPRTGRAKQPLRRVTVHRERGPVGPQMVGKFAAPYRVGFGQESPRVRIVQGVHKAGQVRDVIDAGQVTDRAAGRSLVLPFGRFGGSVRVKPDCPVCGEKAHGVVSPVGKQGGPFKVEITVSAAPGGLFLLRPYVGNHIVCEDLNSHNVSPCQ